MATGIALALGASAGTASAVGTVATAAAVGGALYSASKSTKAAKEAQARNNELLGKSQGAFDPLQVPEVAEPPSAEEILAAYRNEITQHFPEYAQIADQAARDELDNRREIFGQANPKYFEALTQLTDNALSLSRGELPKDTQQAILRQSNQDANLRGFSYGRESGGPVQFAGANRADQNLSLRNLGLNSLNAMQLGNQLIPVALGESRNLAGRVPSAIDVLPGVDIFAQDAANQTSYQQALLNRDAAVANSGPQAQYNQLLFETGLNNANAQLGSAASAAQTQAYATTAGALLQGYSGFSGLGRSTVR